MEENKDPYITNSAKKKEKQQTSKSLTTEDILRNFPDGADDLHADQTSKSQEGKFNVVKTRAVDRLKNVRCFSK